MKNKVKHFKGILVLAIIAIITLIVGIALFATALKVMKEGGGGVIGGIFILVLFFLCVAVSGVLAIIDLPFTVIFIAKSKKRKFPLLP